ncbi:hypothetical protein F383_34760 [Gossypium arboreum]|uniref:Uncharacterized protein n=1 Tax=Gossypium arboreum TaxID=29729 RepID=A0A0B0N506_GOSAR|nr:hypothetical protein F383_34760 [Gossypium arboreum]
MVILSLFNLNWCNADAMS